MVEPTPLSDLASKSSEPISLDALADRFDLSDIDLRKQILSERIAQGMLQLFKLSVGFTVTLTIGLAILDYIFLWNGKLQPGDRLITEKVLFAVIGASVIQLGTGMIAVVYSLFKRPSGATSDASEAQ